MTDFERARITMVDTQLRTSGITDPGLLSVMGTVPRERFVPEGREDIAYADLSHPLSDAGHRLPPAAAFAKLVQLAEVGPTDIVLDIGCGTGYSTAVLAGLSSAVVGLENDAGLVEKANGILADLDIGNAAVLAGKLEDGVPSEAPFDVIVVEGEVDFVPPALLDQLRDGGRLVALVADGPAATARIFMRSGEDVAVRPAFNATLPRLPAMQRQPGFVL